MHFGKRSRGLGRGMIVAAATAGTIFQVSSCSVDDNGVINAFADPAALSDLRTQLLAASPIGQLFGNIDASVEVHVGTDE